MARDANRAAPNHRSTIRADTARQHQTCDARAGTDGTGQTHPGNDQAGARTTNTRAHNGCNIQPHVSASRAPTIPAPLPETPPQTAPAPSSSASSDFALSPPEVSAVAGPPLPAPPKANGQVIDISEFQRQINTALHEAAHKMNVLRGIKMIGQVQLVVHYRDGKAWDPRIIKSSGFPMLDHAVTDAVAEAAWPSPPKGLEGREIIIPIAGSFW